MNIHMLSAGVALLKYFESMADPETGSASGTGLTILKAIHVLGNGPESLVATMTSCSLCSIIVRCLHLFLDLTPPSGE